ncbi:hypothetical protein, variant [Puccinia striiformis f. sp. tritici PST-78]|nr:hypothetical protein, variant [Puccinia striiformis f. sp. tritici PST-78]
MSNAEENTTGSISDEGVPFSDPISDEAVLLSDEGVPFSDPMSDEAVLLSDEGVPFSDAGSDLEETASIIGSLAKAIVHNTNTAEEIGDLLAQLKTPAVLADTLQSNFTPLDDPQDSHCKDPIKTCEEARSSMSVVRYFNSTEEAEDCRRSLSVAEPSSSVYVEEHSTTKRKNRENDSYEPPSSTEECSTTKRQKQGTDSHVPVASAEVVYAAQPSTAKMCRWSTQETIDMLNLMKSNPSSFIDKAFWLRTNDSLREAGHQDQTPSALRGKWDQCGATINTLKHLLKEEKTITFDEDAQTVHDPLQKAPKIIKALRVQLRSSVARKQKVGMIFTYPITMRIRMLGQPTCNIEN